MDSRETLKYGTFGRKKFGFRAMSRRILKLCVASLLNILCFPGMYNDNSDWQWERSLVMAAGNPQLFQYFYQWTRFKNQPKMLIMDHGYPLFSGFQDQVSVAPPHIWHSESLYWETNSHLDQNFWSDWILEKLSRKLLSYQEFPTHNLYFCW